MHHSQYDSSGWVISSSQRPLPDNTQHSKQTDIHAPSEIWTHYLSRWMAKDPHLKLRGHWDQHCMRWWSLNMKHFCNYLLTTHYFFTDLFQTHVILGHGTSLYHKTRITIQSLRPECSSLESQNFCSHLFWAPHEKYNVTTYLIRVICNHGSDCFQNQIWAWKYKIKLASFFLVTLVFSHSSRYLTTSQSTSVTWELRGAFQKLAYFSFPVFLIDSQHGYVTPFHNLPMNVQLAYNGTNTFTAIHCLQWRGIHMRILLYMNLVT